MNDFVKAIESRESPEETFEGPLASFGQKPPYKKMMPDDPKNEYDKKFRSYKYDYDHAVYIIFRPWNECTVCFREFKEGHLVIPDDADYSCPHTNKKAYLEINRKLIQDGFVQFSRKEEILKNGVILVSLAWLIPHKKAETRQAPPRL